MIADVSIWDLGLRISEWVAEAGKALFPFLMIGGFCAWFVLACRRMDFIIDSRIQGYETGGDEAPPSSVSTADQSSVVSPPIPQSALRNPQSKGGC